MNTGSLGFLCLKTCICLSSKRIFHKYIARRDRDCLNTQDSEFEYVTRHIISTFRQILSISFPKKSMDTTRLKPKFINCKQNGGNTYKHVIGIGDQCVFIVATRVSGNTTLMLITHFSKLKFAGNIQQIIDE